LRPIAVCLLAVLAAAAAAKDAAPAWGYEGHNGAQAWGDLSPGFATCKLGQVQSPIDIREADAKKASLPPIRFHYTPARGRLVNNGHTIQVNITGAGGIGLPDGDYALEQFHFHAPSEEKFDGRREPLDVHLVHRSAQGALAVVAVQFREGKENAALKPVFDKLPRRNGDKRLLPPLDVGDMLPAARGYYRFQGSLTTPPCSEQVTWHVLKEPVLISAEQLRAFRRLYSMNARPIQPLNGRLIETD
jgi:carbonic anhydrase